jgi:hypothetical protein
MKKNWIFVILSIAMLFSLGFLPAPGNEVLNHSLAKPTATKAPNTQVEVTFVNQTAYQMVVALLVIKAPSRSFVSLPPKSTKTIKIYPGTYFVSPSTVPDNKCRPHPKTMKITKNTKFTVVCRAVIKSK